MSVYDLDQSSKTEKALLKLNLKMKVKLAAQLLSHSVYSAIMTSLETAELVLVSSTAKNTANFVLTMNNLFDALNSTNLLSTKPCNRVLSDTNPKVLAALSPGYDLLENLYKVGKKGNLTRPEIQVQVLGNRNKSCLISSGKGVGGGTLINGFIYCRGPREQYNELAKVINDPSWNYDNLLQYFKKTEYFEWTNRDIPINISYHGQVGLLTVQDGIFDEKYATLFFEANKELGYSPIDYNGPDMIGSTIIQKFTKFGKRQDFGNVFISPFLGRSSLEVTTRSYVIKIEINNVTKIAESVLFTKDGKIYRAKASKEILLSGGTIASPKILMLSGIGPKNHLEALGIDVIQNLEVGNRYKDHVIVPIPLSTDLKLQEKPFPVKLAQFLRGYGDLTSPTCSNNLGFFQINKNISKIPDFEIFSYVGQNLTATMQPEVQPVKNTNIFFSLLYFGSKSTGTLRLKSNNPYDYPLIDPNLLSDSNNEDIDGLYRSLKYVFKLVDTKPYKKYNLKFLDDRPPKCAVYQYNSKDYWQCYLKQGSINGLHMTGTCVMGTDPTEGAVIDSNLKVFGIKNLRVVDSSIFPEPIVGHSTIPCATVAEKISDVIKIDYGQTIDKLYF
ncbi:glucose dehydrogenase [FAD, quinone]-like isoform X2 [Diorhabda sublineata]|uniref:glucose dehydrogenase [FAD, quinone]-like isoform X2 n=1 Tax=Diorhabda sublineata TaxID=1163346 RepID=UPI0024E0B92C|nr:glucose dehydrogenase [FAD, quinone]-like isoform X2 [Diorhabda sublineata]